MAPMEYLGARATLIHEKTWSKKSRVRLPLKHIFFCGKNGVEADGESSSLLILHIRSLFTKKKQLNII